MAFYKGNSKEGIRALQLQNVTEILFDRFHSQRTQLVLAIMSQLEQLIFALFDSIS